MIEMANSRVKGVRPITLLFALTVLICAMLIAPAAAAALPDRVNVNASYNGETPDYGTLNFSTIQEAIDGVAEGGEVWVYNGTYNESIVIARSMTVTTVSHLVCPGLNGTTIDAMYEPVGIEINADNVSVSGFEVVNASAVGINAHSVSAVTIEYNSVVVRSDTYELTCGILIEGGEGVAIGNNEVRVIGSGGQGGIMVEGVTEAYVHDNDVVAVSRHLDQEAAGIEANPAITALVPEDDGLLSIAVEDSPVLEPNGVLIVESTFVLVESNRVVSVGACIPDEQDPHYAAVDAWGIRSSVSENLKVLENNVTVVGVAANATRTVGILGTGDLALIQNNTVETYTESQLVQPVGIVLDRASKGQVLDNEVEMEVECVGTSGEELMESAGIIAVESYKAQVTGNDIHYMLLAAGPENLALAEIEGIDIVECDEPRVSENIVIVMSEIAVLPTGDEPMEGEESFVAAFSRVTGIDVEMSDEPEIIENVVHAFGTAIAYDGTAADEPLSVVASDLVLTGIWVWGGYDEPVSSPVIDDNVVVVRAQDAGIAGMNPYFEDVEAAIADNSELSARYAAMMQGGEEGSSAATCLSTYLTDAEEQSVVANSVLEYEPSIVEATLVEARVATAGIVLEDVVNPTVCHNYVPVRQRIIVYAVDGSQPGNVGLFSNTLPIGLIEQAVTGEEMQQAVLLSLIDENDSEWQNLSEADRTAITDAVLSGDWDVLAVYAENETLFATDSGMADTLLEYQALIEDEGTFEFLNVTRLAATVPYSMSYGLLFYDAEGDLEIYGNEFLVETNAISVALAEGDTEVPDAAAGSAGLVTAFGISGNGDSINIEENTITVDTQGTFLNLVRGGENETADVAAGSAHLLLAVGVSADADDELILNNNITVMQRTMAEAEAINRVKDKTALSVAATAGVGVGIVLDADDVFDPSTYEPAPPMPEEWFADVIQGNTISVTDEIEVASIAGMLLPAPLDGSSNALSGAVGAAASFGIVAPEAEVLDNVVNATASQSSMAAAFVEEVMPAVQAVEIDLPGTGAANLGVAVSGGILTLRSYIANNIVFTEANSEVVVEAATEELLEDAGVLGGTVAVDVGIVSLSPSFIDGNTVDGAASASAIGMVEGDRVDGEVLVLGMNLGILSRGSDATFNNIHNGYIGFPYYYEEEECEPYAFYNWWGDASGPSDLGPGTGSPVTGTMNYEPWLTKPADIVIETGKSYFGLEIGSPNIGGDGYRYGLEPGWNTLSFPLALENNTWQAVTHAGDGLDYAVACTWDAASQRWVQMTATSKINPLDAVYIKMNDYDRLPVAISPEITNPPVKTLRAGWNLVGPAYDLANGPIEVPDNYFWWGEPYGTPVTRTLASVEQTPAGLTGYIAVVSPSINPEAWVYTPGDGTEPDMDATCGYWVFMENPDTLAGFSSTPLPMPGWAWDL
ncbi:hypothetical protein [Methanoculleus sp.]|uniref:hypothetical protein n=1 Tax=Methanoculleus sp. TaxID=90427 RepID=UPI0025E7DDAD|nr:hypothetical protein [Methanoculleus sp.]